MYTSSLFILTETLCVDSRAAVVFLWLVAAILSVWIFLKILKIRRKSSQKYNEAQEYQKGFKDGLAGNQIRPVSISYLEGFSKGSEIKNIQGG